LTKKDEEVIEQVAGHVGGHRADPSSGAHPVAVIVAKPIDQN
jgi:hypothetical protein